MEVTYTDDPFDDRDMSIEGQGFHDVELCKKAFHACGRTRMMFKNDTEVSRWRHIDKDVANGNMPIEWVLHRIDQCTYQPWGLANLMLNILNIGRMEEWIHRNMRELGGTIIEEDKGAINTD